MTNEPSQRPWTLFVHDEQGGGDGEISICAEGEWIATMNLRRSTAKDDAALIVDAVNERDRLAADEARYRTDNVVLRDIVRRMADMLEHVSNEHRFDFYELVRDARAAIGEDKP